jgi:hypothetical protein
MDYKERLAQEQISKRELVHEENLQDQLNLQEMLVDEVHGKQSQISAMSEQISQKRNQELHLTLDGNVGVVNATKKARGKAVMRFKPISQKRKGILQNSKEWVRGKRRIDLERLRHEHNNDGLTMDSVRMHDVLCRYLDRQDRMISDYKNETGSDIGDLDSCVFKSYGRVYDTKKDGSPAKKEDEQIKKDNREFFDAWLSKDLEKRRPYLDNMVGDWMSMDVSMKMTNKKWVSEHSDNYRIFYDKLAAYERIKNDEINRDYLDGLDPALSSLLEEKLDMASTVADIIDSNSKVWGVSLTARGEYVPNTKGQAGMKQIMADSARLSDEFREKQEAYKQHRMAYDG